jgi:zinc transport system permease protein
LVDLATAWELFRDAIVCAVLAGVVLGGLGVHVVVRRMVFASAALAEAAALGVMIGFFVEIYSGLAVPPSLTAIGVALLAAVGLAWRPEAVSREVILAAVWIGSAALALVVGASITQEAHDVAEILLGSAVLVRPEDLWRVAGSSVFVAGAAAVLHRGLVFAGFDEETARVHGLPVRALEVALWALITIQVATCTRALGALPVFAFSVLPGAAALLWVGRLQAAFPVAAALGAVSGAGGFLLAFVFDLPVGASQAGVATALFACGMLWSRARSSALLR